MSKQKKDGTIGWTVKVKLTEDELLEFGRKLARATRELAAANSDKKSFNAQIKAREERANADITKFENCISDEAEWREMECDQILDYELQTVLVVRPDTGEIVDSREMTQDEKQTEMF